MSRRVEETEIELKISYSDTILNYQLSQNFWDMVNLIIYPIILTTFKLLLRALKDGYYLPRNWTWLFDHYWYYLTKQDHIYFFETFYRWVCVSNRNVNKAGLIISIERLMDAWMSFLMLCVQVLVKFHIK